MVKDKIDELMPGQVLQVDADDPAAEEDVTRWVKRTGQDMLKHEKAGNMVTFYIRKVKRG